MVVKSVFPQIIEESTTSIVGRGKISSRVVGVVHDANLKSKMIGILTDLCIYNIRFKECCAAGPAPLLPNPQPDAMDGKFPFLNNI